MSWLGCLGGGGVCIGGNVLEGMSLGECLGECLRRNVLAGMSQLKYHG